MYEKLKSVLNDSKRIAFFGGAGVSTESGLPDFRSESGLYKAMHTYGSPPEEILSYSFFRNRTETFFDYYKNSFVYMDVKPNDAHIALSKLEDDGRLIAVITQNVDGLHQVAGSRKVYELHGSVMRNFCLDCKTPYDLEYIMDPENCKVNGKASLIPRCSKCQGIIRPDVVLYEEALDQQVISGAVEAISQADTLIVGGTSLIVYPAAGLINYFRGDNLILINKSKTQYDNKATLVINDSIGKVLGNAILSKNNS